eukprot:GHVU01178917.1.p1 GENE.GHVU01178917.1~~GHVU01178917.1.p1  ORF type:complete len:657 (-),score=140.48 GHVU01178917.1:136-2106(-)
MKCAGKEAHCNLCGFAFELPGYYYALLNAFQRDSRDSVALERPELWRGVIDFEAPTELCTLSAGSGNGPAVAVIVLEASTFAVASGFKTTVLYALQQLLPHRTIAAGVAIVAYDDASVYFFPGECPSSKSNGLLVLNDLTEPFCPNPPSSLCVSDDAVLSRVIDRVPHAAAARAATAAVQFQQANRGGQGGGGSEMMAGGAAGMTMGGGSNRPMSGGLSSAANLANASQAATNAAPENRSPAYAAIAAAVELAAEAGGGSVLFFCCSHCDPHQGFPGDSGRGGDGMTSADGSFPDPFLRKPHPAQSALFTKITDRSGDSGVAIDVVACQMPSAPRPLPLPSLGYLTRHTGGRLIYLEGFEILRDYQRLYYSIHRLLTRPMAFDVTMKVRCSRGVQVLKVIGPGPALAATRPGAGSNSEPSLLRAPRIDGDTSYVFSLKQDDRLDGQRQVYVQAACLYKRVDGRRLLRVLTLSVPVTSSLSTVFRYADLDAVVGTFARTAAAAVVAAAAAGHGGHTGASSPFSKWREEIVKDVADILYSYRLHCAASSSSGQLILPDSLKLLPIYCSALSLSLSLSLSLYLSPSPLSPSLYLSPSLPFSLSLSPWIPPGRVQLGSFFTYLPVIVIGLPSSHTPSCEAGRGSRRIPAHCRVCPPPAST